MIHTILQLNISIKISIKIHINNICWLGYNLVNIGCCLFIALKKKKLQRRQFYQLKKKKSQWSRQ